MVRFWQRPSSRLPTANFCVLTWWKGLGAGWVSFIRTLISFMRVLLFFLFYFILIFKVIYFWLCWVFVAAQAFLQLWKVGAALQSWFLGFSCCRAEVQGSRASAVVAQAQLLRGTWYLPKPGIEPVSPALAARFLTTGPPGKSQGFYSYDLSTSIPNTITVGIRILTYEFRGDKNI